MSRTYLSFGDIAGKLFGWGFKFQFPRPLAGVCEFVPATAGRDVRQGTGDHRRDLQVGRWSGATLADNPTPSLRPGIPSSGRSWGAVPGVAEPV